MKKVHIFIIFILLLALNDHSYSQIIKSYGIKLGPAGSTQRTEHIGYVYNPYYQSHAGMITFDVGLFAEFFQLKAFSVLTELHYSMKGKEKSEPVSWSPSDPFEPKFVDVSNKFHYLSFESLFKLNIIPGKNRTFYGLIGPRWDFRIANYSTEDKYIPIDNYKFEFGVTFGAGLEFKNGVLTELRFEPNFTNTYIRVLSDQTNKIRNNLLSVLIGYKLNKIIGK
ncbi:MAG: PorT family protein [Ignavibacteriae bacterium]|nr:MAG: PorT family protein [Ignavibacteriota bacterium]